MTTTQRCWDCGTVFTRDFGSYYCNVCHQSRKQAENFAEESRRNREHAERMQREFVKATTPPPEPAPIITWITDEEREEFRRTYVPPSAEEKQKAKETKRKNTLLSLGVDLSLPIAWMFLWLITSGWFTAISFIAAIAIPFYLNEKHDEWKYKNAKYLYQI